MKQRWIGILLALLLIFSLTACKDANNAAQSLPTAGNGGKLSENITQAVARDCLFYAIEHLTAAGYKVVFDVHDEVVLEVPENQADLDSVVQIMSQSPPWAPDLPLNADGWVNPFYHKD